MNLSRWGEVKKLVQEALDLPLSERHRYLASIADEELRLEVERLLAIPQPELDTVEDFRMLPVWRGPVREGDRVAGYSVLRTLGEGGMSSVYLAKDERHGRLVALKLLSAKGERLSIQEEKALGGLVHPNIATLYESGTTREGLRYFAMEYVEGVGLSEYAEKHCPTVESRLKLFRKICAAVSYAHQGVVVHRDLKPENILVTAAGEPKLLDFGIAKLLSQEDGDATITRAAERPFTLAFASPEQIAGEYTATTTDIYSLGVLLSVLVSGRLPYRVTSIHELAGAIRLEEPSKPSDLAILPRGNGQEIFSGPKPPEGNAGKLRKLLLGDLDAIVLKALRKEPSNRYQSVADLSEDVRRYLESEAVSARRGTSRYRAWKFIRRHQTGVIASGAAAFLLFAFTAALAVQYRATIRERDNARRQATRAESVAEFLIEMFKVENAWTFTGNSAAPHQVLDDALLKLDADPPEDPETRGTLRQALGRTYLNLGLYTPAETLLRPALGDLERTRGQDHALLYGVLADLGKLGYLHGRYDEAEGYSKRAASHGRSLGGDQRIREFELRSLLGHIAFARGEFKEAERLFREALALSPRKLLLLGAENDLGCALHEQGKLAEARRLYQSALRGRQKLLGERHAYVVESTFNLARLSEDEGKPQEAERLYRLAHSLRDARSPYYPIRHLLVHGLGSHALNRERYDEAGLWLNHSLSTRRQLYPDLHPDIARSLAELARLSHALGRYDEALPLYREGLARLTSSLGPRHVDRIRVANNLAALLAEEGKREEAKGIWQELRAHIKAESFVPRVRLTIERNLKILEDDATGAYQTLPVSGLELSDLDTSRTPLRIARRAEDSATQSLLFFDDFNDGTIDTAKWEYGGDVVKEEEGELRVLRTVTDNGGWARTRPIAIDPRRPLVVSRRVKVHPANHYFDGGLYFSITGYPHKRFGVSYANYLYTGNGEQETVGFSIYRNDSNSHRYLDRKANASPLIAPLWGSWFDEEIRFDPRTGEVRYFIAGRLRLVYNVSPLPPQATTITLTVSTWGWYTGHYQHLDSLSVKQ